MSGLLGAFERMSPPDAARALGLVDAEHEYRFRKEDVTAAFRAKASATHPDHGGEEWQMRAILEARDVLLRRAEKPARTRRQHLETAEALEMQEFSARIKVDLASCYLALPRIRKHGLNLDNPRAEKLARGEANRWKRGDKAVGGVITPPRDGLAAIADSNPEGDVDGTGGTWMKVDESLIAERFREKPEKPKKWARDLIHPATPLTPLGALIEKEEAAARVAAGLPADLQEAADAEREALKKRALDLREAIKPRDREVLDLYIGQGLSIKQIAEIAGKTDKAVYASIARMGAPLREARERKEWVDEHCAIEKLSCGVESAPVVLSKTGQMGWDLGVAI